MFVFINGRERRWHLRNVSWQLLLRVCVCVCYVFFLENFAGNEEDCSVLLGQ